MKIPFFLVSLSLAPAMPVAAETGLQTSAYRNSIAQDEIRQQAEEVRGQLAVLLEDIQQNQLNTPEFAQTRDAITRLSTLEDKQILPLIQMLREAGTMEKETEVQGQLVEASKEQKQVTVLLKTLSDTLNLHKDQASMQQRLEQLALRQTTNLRQTRDVAAAKRPRDKLPAELAALAAVAQAEQTALKTELDLARSALERVVAAVPEAQKPAFAAALEELNRSGAAALAEATAADLQAGDFARAAEAGQKLRDALQSAAVSFRSAMPADERTRALADRVQRLSEKQKALGEATEKAASSSRQELREEQRKLSDELAVVQKELQNLNAAAATETREAAKVMENAAKDLGGDKELKPEARKAVAAVQEEAARKLAAAGAELGKAAEKLAQTEVPKNAAQAAAALGQLSSEIAQAQAQTQAAPPDSAQQKQLATKVAELQQKALPLNSEAARSLGQAAAQMQEKNPEAAAQALAQANAEIQQQAQALARAAVQQQALQAVSNQVSAAKAEASRAQQTMKGTEGNQSAAIKQMEAAQATLQQAQQMAGATASPEAKKALQQAQQALNESRLNAAQTKKSAAMAANARAQENLQQALQSMSQGMAGAMAQAMPASSSQGEPSPSQDPGQNQTRMVQDGSSGGGMAGAAPMGLGKGEGPRGAGQVMGGLSLSERAAVAALQKEKAPAEYQAMAQQYWKNLASGTSPGTPLP